MKTLLHTLSMANTWWRARAARERAMLIAMALVLSLAAVFMMADWVHKEQTRLDRTLPAARTALATMREQATELENLLRQPARPKLSSSELLQILRIGSQARKLGLDIRQEGENVRATGDTDFDPLISWLGEVQRDYGVQADQFKATRAGAAVKADILLVAPDSR